MFPYILDPVSKTLTLVMENKQHTLNADTHPNFDKILDAIRSDDQDRVRELVDLTRAVANYSNGFLEVKDGDVYWDGKPFHNSLSSRLLEMMKADLPIEPLVEFMHNLKLNPSKRSVDELYGFLENNSLPITSDGHFLAYKKVREDYKDIYSGTMDNSVGKIVEMVRNEVDEDKDRTCSTGLHFCSLAYLPHFGWSNDNRVVIVKINPRDVVSIPSDYDNAKGRACRYEVVGEHTAEGYERNTTEAFNTVVFDFEPFADYDDADDDIGPDWDRGYGDYDEDLDDYGPREVYRDSQGRYRFADNGRYASREDYETWVNGGSRPAATSNEGVREVVVDSNGRYRYADNGQYASLEAKNDYLAARRVNRLGNWINR